MLVFYKHLSKTVDKYDIPCGSRRVVLKLLMTRQSWSLPHKN